MRILGFSKKWGKLNKQWFESDYHTFTTFRFPRKDRDWEIEEIVQIVYKPRSKEREPLGIARIIRKQEKDLSKKYYEFNGVNKSPDVLTPDDAKEDGFIGMHGGGDVEKMMKFLSDSYGYCAVRDRPMNKLTLYWISRE